MKGVVLAGGLGTRLQLVAESRLRPVLHHESPVERPVGAMGWSRVPVSAE